MKFTKNFNFKKPEPLDTVNINDLNDSFDMIDEKLKETEEENKRLDTTFKELIINAGNSNAEIVDARVEEDGTTHATLGDRLNKVDDKIKKIETLKIQDEIEISTDKGYVVVEDTNNGQITDIKIEGNTITNPYIEIKGQFDYLDPIPIPYELKPNTTYTFFIRNKSGIWLTFRPNSEIFTTADQYDTTEYERPLIFSLTTKEVVSSQNIFISEGDGIINTDFNLVILEGDYSQESPSYFEGLKSVGSEVGVVEVLSNNNLDNFDENYQEIRKQVLFRNNEGNYEKVVLRKLPNGIKDTIEKHSNGKYYYHKRCEELVLNGGENWVLNNSISVNKDTSLKFETTDFSSLVLPITDANISNHIMSDKFKSSTDSANHSDADESITQTVSPYNSISIRIDKTKLSSQDASGFKQWLQNNNVQVIVALAKEEVYECTNIDLDCFEGDTSVICNSNIPPSNMSFKVANHISNTVEVMKDRISDTETKIREMLNSDMVQSLAQNGYKILPGGMILQWGKVGIVSNVVDFATTFPISFPNECISVFVSMEGRDNNWNARAYGHALSQDRCRLVVFDNDSTYHNCINWFAIGY